MRHQSHTWNSRRFWHHVSFYWQEIWIDMQPIRGANQAEWDERQSAQSHLKNSSDWPGKLFLSCKPSAWPSVKQLFLYYTEWQQLFIEPFFCFVLPLFVFIELMLRENIITLHCATDKLLWTGNVMTRDLCYTTY